MPDCATISIQVDTETAQAFAAAPPSQRRKIELLLGLTLKELTSSASRPLDAIMDEMSREAAANGLTPEILASILNEK